jgi:hypothetical protein
MDAEPGDDALVDILALPKPALPRESSRGSRPGYSGVLELLANARATWWHNNEDYDSHGGSWAALPGGLARPRPWPPCLTHAILGSTAAEHPYLPMHRDWRSCGRKPRSQTYWRNGQPQIEQMT